MLFRPRYAHFYSFDSFLASYKYPDGTKPAGDESLSRWSHQKINDVFAVDVDVRHKTAIGVYGLCSKFHAFAKDEAFKSSFGFLIAGLTSLRSVVIGNTDAFALLIVPLPTTLDVETVPVINEVHIE